MELEYIWQFRDTENDNWTMVEHGQFSPDWNIPKTISVNNSGWYRYGVKFARPHWLDWSGSEYYYDLNDIGEGITGFCQWSNCPENWREDPMIAEKYNPFFDYIYSDPISVNAATVLKHPGLIGHSQVIQEGQVPAELVSIIEGTETGYQWQISYDKQAWMSVNGATQANYQPSGYYGRPIYYRRSNGNNNYSNIICLQPPATEYSDENHIVTISPYTAQNTVNPENAITSVVYYDGLGRPMQEVAVNATSHANDLVRPIIYDALGRESHTFLPYEQEGGSGKYTETYTALANQHNFYWQKHPDAQSFTEIQYEASPLSRVMAQSAAHDNSIFNDPTTFRYESNGDNEIKLWDVDANGNLTDNGYYAANQLLVIRTELPDNLTAVEYKNKSGQVVETWSQNRSWPDEILRTSYVYDDMGRLRYVIPPKAYESALAMIEFRKLTYSYGYDAQNRMITKKLPDSDEHYMIYDSRDRMVMSQDGNLREKGQWRIYLYDVLNRPVADGIITTSLTRSNLTTLLNDTCINQSFSNGSYTLNTPPDITLTTENLLNYTYYDNYDWIPSGMAFSRQPEYNDEPNPYVKGQVTGVATKVLDHNYDSSYARWLYTATYYDDKYRPVQIRKDIYTDGNNGLSVVNSAYLFDGNIEKHHEQQLVNNHETNIATRYVYDHMRRPVGIYHQVNNQPETLLSYTLYDELGRAQTKYMGNNVQEVNYAYNIRNALTGINSDNEHPQINAFSMNLYYSNAPDSIRHFAGPLRNDGNITTVSYKHNHENGQLNVTGYEYDVFNRLTRSETHKTNDNTDPLLYYENNMLYDSNGNIRQLDRENRIAGEGNSYRYTYNGNQLKRISGAVRNYEYNRNGNMTFDGLRNLDITYNTLNLPKK